MKYIVEVSISQLIEVEAKNEEDAREQVKNSLDIKQQQIAEIRVAKEFKI